MRVRIQDQEIPFPLNTIRGKLRLSGVTDPEISTIISDIEKSQINSQHVPTELAITKSVEDSLSSKQPQILKNFQTLLTYNDLRGESEKVPPLILSLEGASATGKSMLAINLVQDLTSTRFISTDTVRQILRGIYSEKDHPELHCHTYQAFKYRQTGSHDLEPVVRGYLAQCDLINPYVNGMVKRVHDEGLIGVIEGVHIHPGTIKHLSKGVLEIIINPDEQTHKSMFLSKSELGKLRSVSANVSIRDEEYQSTRKIQNFMIAEAKKHDLPIIELETYEKARSSISNFIINKIENIVAEFQ